MFKFITYEKKKKITRDQLLTGPSIFPTNFDQFIYEQPKDEVFLKNIEKLETFEIVLSNDTAPRTLKWDLRIGTLKNSLPFAFTFNSTHSSTIPNRITFSLVFNNIFYIY